MGFCVFFVFFSCFFEVQTILGCEPWAEQGGEREEEAGGGEQQSSSVEAGGRWVS